MSNKGKALRRKEYAHKAAPEYRLLWAEWKGMAMKKIADRQEWRMPATIDDPLILDEIIDSLAAVGYGPKAEPTQS